MTLPVFSQVSLHSKAGVVIAVSRNCILILERSLLTVSDPGGYFLPNVEPY